MSIDDYPSDIDHWELDQCRYCKGPIEDPTEAYCSSSCELKWIRRNDGQTDNSPAASSVFSGHPNRSIQSTPRSTPASSAHSTPEISPVLPTNSVPNLTLEAESNITVTDVTDDRRRLSYMSRSYKYGSSHNPIKKSYPSNYYQSTFGDRSNVQQVFADKSVSLGIRKTSLDEIRTKPAKPTISTDRSVKQLTPLDKKEPSTPTSTDRAPWSWRRFSTFL
jgi:hypothetical protein